MNVTSNIIYSSIRFSSELSGTGSCLINWNSTTRLPKFCSKDKWFRQPFNILRSYQFLLGWLICIMYFIFHWESKEYVDIKTLLSKHLKLYTTKYLFGFVDFIISLPYTFKPLFACPLGKTRQSPRVPELEWGVKKVRKGLRHFH